MTKYLKSCGIVGVTLLVLTACTQQVPDSGQGVGFSDFAEFEIDRARREAALQGNSTGLNTAPPAAIVPPSGNGVSSSDLAAAGISGAQNTIPATTGPTVVPATPSSNGEISDEQSFDAVAERETIESDAQRRERQAAAYQLIQATALPVRNGVVEPNIVQYALQAPNDRGQVVFSRSGLSGESRFQRNCAAYRTPDEAQRDFLTRGGPQRDRLGLDPDGDGFACGWDPQAFRSVARGN